MHRARLRVTYALSLLCVGACACARVNSVNVDYLDSQHKGFTFITSSRTTFVFNSESRFLCLLSRLVPDEVCLIIKMTRDEVQVFSGMLRTEPTSLHGRHATSRSNLTASLVWDVFSRTAPTRGCHTQVNRLKTDTRAKNSFKCHKGV